MRFSPGDVAELRKWTTSVRAVVQRLTQTAPPVLTAGEGAFVRADGSTLIASRIGEVGAGPAVVAIDMGIVEGVPVLALSTADASAKAELLLLEGRSALAALADDALAARQWLLDQGATRVGFAGAGAGKEVAMIAAILAGDDSPVFLDGPIESYTQVSTLALPGILRYADQPDLVAALAPRPLLLTGSHQTVTDAYKAFGAELVTDMAAFTKALHEPATVPFIPPLKVLFGVEARLEIADRLDQVLASGMLTQGKLVPEFEELAHRFTGGEHTPVAVATGTAALDIAYQLLNVSGRTVLAPVNTFFATAASIERMGGKVDFVDIELEGFGMDPASLREALDRHDDVAAVVVVHIAGVVSPSFREVLAECAARGIPVVEDTAHALGSTLDGKLAGSMGAMGTYSLHPAKVATSGEGGFFIAQDQAHLEAARKLRDHGKISIDKNIHDRLGNNWRLSEVHATVGLAHFGRLDEMLAMRRELAAWYDAHIDTVPRVTRYVVPSGAESNYYKYVAFLDPEVDRADLKARLRQRHGVALAGEVYDVLLSDQPFFADRFAGRAFPNAKWFTSHHICLPAFPSMTMAEQRHVLHALRTELS